MSTRSSEPYIDSKGRQHFADVDVGDNSYYSAVLDNVVINPMATVDSAVWTLPPEITTSDSFILGHESFNKLQTNVSGVFEIVITVDSNYSGKDMTELSKVYLTVYD